MTESRGGASSFPTAPAKTPAKTPPKTKGAMLAPDVLPRLVLDAPAGADESLA